MMVDGTCLSLKENNKFSLIEYESRKKTQSLGLDKFRLVN